MMLRNIAAACHGLLRILFMATRKKQTLSAGGGAFPATRWTLIQRMKRGTTEYRAAMEQFLGSYWNPVYTYVRGVWGKSSEDAKDLTQDFFVHALSQKVFQKTDRDRGTLRSLLKTALRNFLMNSDAARRRQKRGGEVGHVAIDHLTTSRVPSVREQDEEFDHEWAAFLMQRALERTRRQLKRQDKERHVRILEAIDLSPEKRSYREVAESLHLKESDVRNHLAHARSVLKQALVDEIALYSDSKEEILAEFRLLYGGGA